METTAPKENNIENSETEKSIKKQIDIKSTNTKNISTEETNDIENEKTNRSSKLIEKLKQFMMTYKED
jgi:hypothetical protein